MATFKAVIREKQTRCDGKVNIKIRLTHKGKAVYLSTNQYILPKDFDNKSGTVKTSHPNANYLNPVIHTKISEMERIVLKKYEDNLEYINVYTIKDALKKIINTTSFLDYADRIISELRENGKDGNADIYTLARKSFAEYLGHNITFPEINYQLLTSYHNWMIREKKSLNTQSLYLRTIRAIYNRALDEEIVTYDMYPFRKFKIPKPQPTKRNLPPFLISRIANCELKGAEEKARDVFMLSFYLIGINLADLYNMKRDQLFADRIEYTRQKTHQNISVKVHPEAMDLIEKYKAKGKYLFTFNSDYSDRKTFNKQINKYLKNVARRLGITKPLSVYYARHSWATIAVSLGYSQDAIAFALGHKSSTVTSGYIDYDPAIVDNINRAVIDYVKTL